MLIYGFLVRDNIEALVSIVTISKHYVVLEAKHVCFGLPAVKPWRQVTGKSQIISSN